MTTYEGVVKGEPGDDNIYINMYKALGHLREERKMRVNEPHLLAELRQHPRFVRSNHIEKDNPLLQGQCWVFEKVPI